MRIKIDFAFVSIDENVLHWTSEHKIKILIDTLDMKIGTLWCIIMLVSCICKKQVSLQGEASC